MPSKIGLGFKLKEYLSNLLNLKEDIQPVLPPQFLETSFGIMDLGWLLGHQQSLTVTTALSSTGITTIYTTTGECRERIDFIHIRLSTGTWTFAGLYIWDASKSEQIAVDSFSSATVVRWPENLFLGPIWLEAGDGLRINVDALTVAGNCLCTVWKKIWSTKKYRDPWHDV